MTGRAVVEDGTQVDIAECCLDTDADIALSDAYADLDEGERARAASFVFPRDRDRFIRAHGHLRRRLGAFLGMEAKAVPIVGAEGEKPFLAGGGARFSLSHSGSRAVVAITANREVGIDLETLDRSDAFFAELDGLARACMTGEEQGALARLPRRRRVRRFLSYWTAKEARMKLTGEGLTLEPHTIALKLSGGRPVGYLRPRGPRAALRFVPLSAPNTICCLALG
jgi:4'-phosphopantetheinyl transferase